MGENNKKTEERILVVDDEQGILDMIEIALKKEGREINLVDNIKDANGIIASLLSKSERPIDVAIIDLHLTGTESGSDFARRLFDIIVNVNVVIATGDPIAARSLSFKPDEILIKPFNRETIVRVVEELIELKRLAQDPIDVRLNCFLITTGLVGIDSLKAFSRDMDENVEKMVAMTEEGEYVSFVVYPPPTGDANEINIGVACLVGCPSGCEFCLNWRGLSDGQKLVKYKRQLTAGEIIAQFYLAMIQSKRVREALADQSDKKIVFNVTCGGDSAYNLDNTCEAIRQLLKAFERIFNHRLECIITTIGTEKSLMEYRRRYPHLPVTFYWSVTTFDEEIRKQLVPGSIGQSLKNMMDSFEMIAKITGRPVTISLIVIAGLTDRSKDVELVKLYLEGRTMFRIKLMKLVEGSLPGYSASDEDVENFRKKLEKVGIKDVRVRDIFGSGLPIRGGCGDTVEKFRDISNIANG